jgi:hypothetical protein
VTSENVVDWRAAYMYLELELESILERVAERMEQLESGAHPGGRCQVRAVTLRQTKSGDLESTIIANGSDLTYSFAVYRDGVLVREQSSGPANTIVWPPSRSGRYRVQGTAKSATEDAPSSATSGELAVTVPPK